MIEEMHEPVLHRVIVHPAILEMRGTGFRSRQHHAVLTANHPAAHHCVGNFGMELDAEGVLAMAKGLNLKGVTLGEQS